MDKDKKTSSKVRSTNCKKKQNSHTSSTKKMKSQSTSIDLQYKSSDVNNMVNLSSPQLCSALLLENQLKSTANRDKNTELQTQLKSMQETSNIKANQKINIPLDEHIFKDLVDLHINDEDVIPEKLLAKNQISNVKKDEVFKLSNYYKPDFSKECVIDVSVPPVEIEKVQYYNGFDIYDKIESLLVL